MNIVVMGAPASGKGTQSKLLSANLGIPHLSTGDMLRSEVESDSVLGKSINKLISKGHFVSDDLITELVIAKLKSCSDGFILDGYPRTINQANQLNSLHFYIDFVFHFNVPEDILISRMLHRAKTLGRTDDTLEVLKIRLKEYTEKTKPVLNLYEDLGLVYHLDGELEIDKLHKQILSEISS